MKKGKLRPKKRVITKKDNRDMPGFIADVQHAMSIAVAIANIVSTARQSKQPRKQNRPVIDLDETDYKIIE